MSRPLPVVLAAGLGSRLGGTPKALFELEGDTLLGRCAAALHRLAFQDMVVVTGHGDDQVRDWWASAPRPLRAQFVHNPRYADLNNFHTLEIACLQAAPGRLLVLNSDIVFADRVVGDAETAGGDLTLAVEAGRVDDEALKVRLVDGQVRELGKHLSPADAHGEFIGVSLLSDDGRARYVAVAGEARDRREDTLYYEDVYSRICRSVDSRVSSVAAGAWAEIDAPEDVPAARRVVLAHAV